MEKMFLTLTTPGRLRRSYDATTIKNAYRIYRMRGAKYKGEYVTSLSARESWEWVKRDIKARRLLSKTVSGILARHKIKASDLPSFDDERVEAFFTELYKAHVVPCHKEALWQAVSTPSKVAYSQRKPNGSYTRVVTTLGKWLRRTTDLDEEAIKRLSERYKTLTNPTAGLTLKVCQDGEEIQQVYEDDTVCKSCMNSEHAVRVYDSSDISVVYAEHDNTVVGRAVCNRETKEFVRAYPTGDRDLTFADKTQLEWREAFLALLEAEGYRHDTRCLLNCRLRFLGHDDDRVEAPYLDGDYKAVTWEKDDEFMVVCHKGDGDSYACDNTTGWSDERDNNHEGQVCIDGEWYDEDEVRWSEYHERHLHIDEACYSDYDDDYFVFDDTITVRRFHSRGYHREESVHDRNDTTYVEGFDYPVLDDELDGFLGAGFVVQIDGEYYDRDHADVVFCDWEVCHALRGDCTEINGEWYTLEYIRDSPEEFLVHDGALAYHTSDSDKQGTPLDKVCELGMAKAIESVYAVNYMPAMAQYDGDNLYNQLRYNVFPAKAKRLRQFLVAHDLELLFDGLCRRAARNHPTLLAYREQERNARLRAA
jgi:hypothetical protein